MKTEEARVTGKKGLLEAPLRGLKKASRTSDLKYYRDIEKFLRKLGIKNSSNIEKIVGKLRKKELKYYRENFGKA